MLIVAGLNVLRVVSEMLATRGLHNIPKNFSVLGEILNCSFVSHQAPKCPKRIHPIGNDYTF